MGCEWLSEACSILDRVMMARVSFMQHGGNKARRGDGTTNVESRLGKVKVGVAVEIHGCMLLTRCQWLLVLICADPHPDALPPTHT
jgi:hypothetical protein